MPCHAIVRLLVALSIICAAAPSFAALSGTATVTTDSTAAPYQYTINLKNTGDVPIEGFWFAWTPPGEPAEYDFLPSIPSPTNYPTYWLGYYTVGNRPGATPPIGYGVEYYDYYSGYGIQPGNTGIFEFTTNDSPAVLASSTGGYPLTTSVIYSGPIEGSPDNIFVAAVPEPAGLTLAGLAAIGGFIWRGRRRAWKMVA